MQHEEILGFFSRYIEKEIGIVYSSHNHFQLTNRLEEICKLSGVATIEALYQQAQKGVHGSFKQLLLDVATNNETSFYRDAKVFKAVETTLQLMLEHKKDPSPIKIWSAACSTGQEPLTLAMILTEMSQKKMYAIEYSMLATDICERALDKARRAIYTQLEVQRGLGAAQLIKYFAKDEQDRWLAKPGLNKFIEYKKLNLNDFLAPREKFDLILCRNVLIYQSVENKIKVIKTLTDSLSNEGFLVMGSGESLLGISTSFEQQQIEGAILYKKKCERLLAA